MALKVGIVVFAVALAFVFIQRVAKVSGFEAKRQVENGALLVGDTAGLE